VRSLSFPATTAICAQPDRVQLYLESARARNTIHGYRSSFHQFEAWCQAVGLCSRRLRAHAVALVVKRYARATGLRFAAFSGHSLRAGFVTSAARAGEPERRIMLQTDHKSIEMVLRYVRQAQAFTNDAALALGL
jgi:integrase